MSNCHLALTLALEFCDFMTPDSVIGTSAAYPHFDTQLSNFILVCLSAFFFKSVGQNKESKMKRASNEKSDIHKFFVRTEARGDSDAAAIPTVDDDKAHKVTWDLPLEASSFLVV